MNRIPNQLVCAFWVIFIAGLHSAPALAATGVTVSPASIDFGTVTAGLNSDDYVITVTNNTDASVVLNSFSLSAPQFQLNQGPAPQTISPGKSSYYTLEFAPDAAQTFTGTFSVDVQNFGVMTVSLTGVGQSTGAIARVTPTAIDFGSVVQGTNSAPRVVTLTNAGTTALTLSTVQLSSPFKTTDISPTTLLPGQTFTFQVMFSPPGTSNYTSALTIGYDVVLPTGISLKGSGIAASSLKIATFSPLALAVKGAAYSAPITAVGGTPPYTFSLQAGSTLPAGLSLSSAGVISGTVDSNVGTASYSFVVKAQDSTSATITKSMTITVQSGTGANCSNISWNITGTSTPIVPLDVLGTGTYLGSMGGLYPGGSNVRPAGHDAYGLQLSQALQPLDANGNPDPAGKEVLLLLGESVVRLEGDRIVIDAKADPTRNPNLVVVNGAQGNGTASFMSLPDSGYWNTIINNDLGNAGVTANQVVVAWVELSNGISAGTFPSDMSAFTDQMKLVAQNLLIKFPNIKIAYLSTRIYSGYSNGMPHLINEEPYAYEIGFGNKWVIEAQLGGDPNLNYDPNVGPVKAPWLAWGPYYWANGLIPNGNGLVWACPEIQDDGTHPTKLRGAEKVANEVLNFFKADSTSVPWYVAASMSFTPSSLTFGDQSVGTSSSPQPITVSNTGSTPLVIRSIVISGDFTESDDCIGNVAPGASCTVNVTFTPTGTGTRTGAVTITDNASGSPHTITLSGTGVITTVSLSPASLTFPLQLINTPSSALPVTLTNTGTGTLTISSIVPTGDYSETDNCGTSLAAGASCTINVTFLPTAIGKRLGTLSVTDNGVGSPQSIPLSGTGTKVQLSPTKLTFGNQPVGTSSAPQIITMTNVATGSIKITGIGLAGKNPSDYTQVNTCGTSLPGGASCTITVTFTPTAVGTRLAQVSITDNGGGSPQLVPLKGTGI